MIGFRLKFDDIAKCNLKPFLLNYISKFDFFEIKLTNNLLKEDKFRYILEISEKYAKGRYSIHLPKNFLDPKFNKDIKKEIIQNLNMLNCKEKINLITHMPFYYDNLFIQESYCILKEVENKYCILLENEKKFEANLKYLKSINDIINCLVETYEVKNLGICFDIGHFLYGLFKENIESDKAYNILLKMRYFGEYIREYHLHDYNERSDHLHINNGKMNLVEVAKFIQKVSINYPIIIETNIINPCCDGLEQIKIVKSKILRKECGI